MTIDDLTLLQAKADTDPVNEDAFDTAIVRHGRELLAVARAAKVFLAADVFGNAPDEMSRLELDAALAALEAT